MESKSERRTRRVYMWPPEHIALLGTMTDADVAKIIGGKTSTVMEKRQSLQIAPFKPKVGRLKGKSRPNFDWTDHHIKLLGTKPDAELARQFGLSNSAVGLKRRSLGISSPKGMNERFVVPPEFIDKLGVWSDAKIARCLNTYGSVISRARRKLGVAAIMKHNILSEEANALLGKSTDTEIARLYGVSVTCVSERRNSLSIARKAQVGHRKKLLPQEAIQKLGKVKDTILAKEYKVSIAVIYRYRQELKIERYIRGKQRKHDATINRRAAYVWNDAQISRLGTAPDTELAKIFNFPNYAVRNKRYALGISAFNNKASPSDV